MLPLTLVGKLNIFLFHFLLLNGWIISALFAAFLASLTWMAAMTKLPLSYAYPFMSLSFVLVTILSVLFFNEVMTIPKVLGLSLIIIGLIVSSSL